MITSPPFARAFSPIRRRTACLLVGLFVFGFALAGSVGAASRTASAGISAHLDRASFTASEAKSVKLIYEFSKPSKSFSYRLTLKKGSKWQLVKRATSKKKKGYFKGSKTTTVKRLFAGKPVKVGSYRLKLSADRGGKLIAFKVVKKLTGTQLDITVWPQGKTQASLEYTLNCPAGTGTLPDAAGACAQLADLNVSAFAPVNETCAEVVVGPEQAEVDGVFAGQPLEASFSRKNPCEARRWASLAFLFAGVGSDTRTQLSITVWPYGWTQEFLEYTLACPAGTGTLPDAAGACAQLSRLDISAFVPSGNGLACSMVVSGPERAEVDGIFDGQPLTASFDRLDSCDTNDWARLAFLFAGYGLEN